MFNGSTGPRKDAYSGGIGQVCVLCFTLCFINSGKPGAVDQNVGFDLFQETGNVLLTGNIKLINICKDKPVVGISVNQVADLAAKLAISACNKDFHQRMLLKYAMVFSSPASSCTLGSQSSSFLAREMSG